MTHGSECPTPRAAAQELSLLVIKRLSRSPWSGIEWGICSGVSGLLWFPCSVTGMGVWIMGRNQALEVAMVLRMLKPGGTDCTLVAG